MPLKPGTVIARRGQLVIRTVRASDVRPLHAHIAALVQERAQILMQHVPTLSEEKAFVRSALADLRSGKGILLVAEWEGEIAGVSGAHRAMVKAHATGHIAMLGIAVGSRFRRKGVGKALLREAMRLAREQWSTRVFWLDVYRTNAAARRLYRKMGFRVTGQIPNGARVRGKVTDVLLMVKGS